MDLARAPRRAARKKGSGYENVVKTVKELQEEVKTTKATSIIPGCYQTNLPDYLHNLVKPLI